MNVTSFSTVKTTNFSKIDLSTSEATSALASYPDLGTATRAGLFSPATATAADTVAVEIKSDGSAVIIVVVETTTLSDTGNASS